MEKKGPNGFLIGLLIGGVVGALVSTKKGRQIVKDITEYGLDYLGNSINMNDIETILNEDEEEMMGGEIKVEEKANIEKDKPEAKSEHTKIYKKLEKEENDEPSRRKRLFKGIRKK